MGMGGQRHAPAALPLKNKPGTHYTGDWMGPRSVWMRAENLTTTWIRSRDRPTRSEPLYRLNYPGPRFFS
jgi:hypothetical protein